MRRHKSRMRPNYLIPKLLVAVLAAYAPAVSGATLDTIVLGDSSSEQSHALVANLSETINGQLAQPARRLLPKNPVEVNGGDLTFTMTVDPVRRNYFSVKLWGGDDTDDDLGRLYLYVPLDGVNYQVGYRHEGDYLPLSVAAGKPPLPGRFFYSTTLLPLWMTQGRTTLTVRLVSTGRLYGLGSGYEGSGGNYQFNMKMPSRGIYRAYTHTEPMLNVSGETQGAAPTVTTRPAVTDTSILGPSGTYTSGLNTWVNNRLAATITAFNTIDVELLAKAYKTPEVTAAHNNPALVAKAVDVIDGFVRSYYAQPALAFTKSTYLTADGFPLSYTVSGGNEVWGGRFGPLGRAIALLKEPLAAHLNVSVDYGSGVTKTRREAWADALRASLDYGRFNRRTITNQTILGDAHIYKANMGLAALGDPRALSETEAQRYLKEACGLLPWRGNDLPNGGSALRYGTAYYQVTPKGMTREWGYVGSYGEMAHHVATFYELTGNAEFLAQSVKMSKARAPFRRPAIEVSGSNHYRTMERTGLLAWRAVRETDGDFANDITYAEPAVWSGGMRVAALSQDPMVTGHAKQMLADNQYLNALVSDTRFYRSLTGDALWAFDAFSDYAAVKAAADSGARLPMTEGQSDFVWSDEMGGVIALKKGNERLWVAPYWQAKTGTGINGVARFHYSTTNYDQYGVLETTPRFRASAYFTRPNYVDKPESVGFVPPDNPVNAYAGEVVPLGFVPADAQDGAPFIGRADFYSFRFGCYLFGMNATTNTTQTLKTPAGFTSAADLVSGTSKSGTVTVGPTNSVVLYLDTATDPAAAPSAPLLLKASGNSSPAVVLNWSASSGAETYKVKRSTTAGGPYTAFKDEDGSDILISETTLTDTDVIPGTAYYYVVSAVNANGESEDSMEAVASAGIGAPWTASDIGSVTLPGNTSIVDDVFTLTGSGSDVGGTADSGHFVSMPWSGNGALIARLSSRAQGGNINDKMGLIIREDNTSGAKNFSIHFDGGSIPDKAKVSYRSSTNGNTSVLFGPQELLPQWMKIERSGNTYIGSISADGLSWTEVGRATFTMNAALRFGIFVCSRDAAAVNVSTFDGVTAPDGWGVPPPAPEGLRAVAGPGSAGLSWSSAAGAMEYLVKRSTTAGGPYEEVAAVSSTAFADSNLANDTTYYYVISARNLNGTSANSSEVEAVPQLGPPPIPLGVAAAGGNGYVQLGWSASFQATSYRVKRSTSSSGPFSLVAEVPDASGFRDVSVVNGTTYYYVVTSVGPGGESASSSVVNATPSAVPPAPLGLQAVAANGSVVLVWPPSLGATVYNVKRATSASGPFSTVVSGLTATGYTDSVLTNGVTYYYVVSASNAAGESANSDAVPVAPSATVLPAPYARQDVGSVGIGGAASFSGGTYTMVASGADIWNSADGFGFIYVPVNGDCTVTVRVASLQNTHPSAKAGVMIRESLTAGSKYAMAAMTPSSGLLFQYRGTTDGSAAQAASSSRSIPYWVRLVRSGNTITAWRSSSGTSWRQLSPSATVAMNSRVYVGLALTSRDNSRTASATFGNFTVVSSGTLAVPSGLAATASAGSVALSWNAVTNATSYNVKRSTSFSGNYATIASGLTVRSYTDTAVMNGQTYFYQVSATGAAGEGYSSASVAATPENWAPAAVLASAEPAGARSVALSWGTVAGADGYRIWRAIGNSGGTFEPVGTVVGATNFTDTTVSHGVRYYYAVTSMRGGAESYLSAALGSIDGATVQSAGVTTGTSGVWANVSATTNGTRYSVTTAKDSTNLIVGAHNLRIGDVVSPMTNAAGFTSRYGFWVVGVGTNSVSVSTTPGGAPVVANASTTNTAMLRGSQRWSLGSNWSNNVVPDGIDAVASFPAGSLPLDVGVVLVDKDVTLGRLVYSNSSNFSDCTLVSSVTGSQTNTLRFEVSGTNASLSAPMIEVRAASQKWLQLGVIATNGPGLRVAGSQGLLLRSSAGGAVTNGLGSNPAKDLSIQNVDWSGFSGGLVVDRGSLSPAYVDRLPVQDLTLGTAFSVSSNALAGLKMGASQTIAALHGNAMGRIWGVGTLTVGANNAGGDFGGIFGQQFNGIRDSNSLAKVGTNRQVMSGIMVGNGSVHVAAGSLVFSGSGTNQFSGAVTVASNAAFYMDAQHAAVAPFTSVTLAGTSGSSTFVGSAALKNDDAVRVTSAAAGLVLGAEYFVVGTPSASTNVQLATNRGGAPVSATATATAAVQFSSPTNGTGGTYTVAAGGTLGGSGRIAPFDTAGGTNAAILISGQLAPGADGAAGLGRLTFDGVACVRGLLKFEPGAAISLRVATATNDSVVVTNAQAGDVAFSGNVVNFADVSGGSLPLQTVIFSADAVSAYAGIATNAEGAVTNGLSIGAGLEDYPEAALYISGHDIVLRLAPPLPPAPSGLVASGGQKRITLTWEAVTNAQGYAVYRSTSVHGPLERIATNVTGTEFTDGALEDGTTYRYSVRSLYGSWESDNEATVIGTTTYSSQQAWRLEFFGTAESAGPAADEADPDGDGFVNGAEFTAGTDPTDARSVFRARPVWSADGGMRVRFDSVLARSYQLLAAPELVPPQWQPLGDAVAGTGGEVELLCPSSGRDKQFYRLEIRHTQP